MEEIWRDVKEYVGLYKVSNWGRVKSMNYRRTGKEQIMNPAKTKKEYLCVSLYKDENKKTFYIHKLVWDTFGSSPRNGHILQVDHIDNNKENNHIDNLQLLNNRENTSKMQLTKEKKVSKYIGVFWSKKANKWTSQIMINKKRYHLGCFTIEKEAAEAYLKSKENLK